MKAAAIPETDEETAGGGLIRRLHGIMAKRPRSQPSDAGSSVGKARQEPEIETITGEVSKPKAELESILPSGAETDEEDEISPSATLHPRSLRTTGPAMTGVEDAPFAEETGRVAVESAAILEHQTIQEYEAVQTKVVSEHGTASPHETYPTHLITKLPIL